jgi:hypothetical protein
VFILPAGMVDPELLKKIGAVTDAAAPVRIPTKPVTDSDLNPAMCSDLDRTLGLLSPSLGIRQPVKGPRLRREARIRTCTP